MEVDQHTIQGVDGMEKVYKDVKSIDDDEMLTEELPGFWQQLTPRALIVGSAIGAVFAIITLKLSLTSGIIPSLNIGAGLLCFLFLKTYGTVVDYFMPGKLSALNKQENTVAQTMAVAISGLAFTGGFGSYLTAMDYQSYLNAGVDTPGNYPEDVVQPDMHIVIPYMLCTSLIGIFILLGLRKAFVVDYKLPYPSGTATGLMIQSFFSVEGAAQAQMQLVAMGKWFGISFVMSAYRWIFSCGDGFEASPNLGMAALSAGWQLYDFAQNYIGVGMICPHIVNFSMLLGACVSWGLAWPLLEQRAGDWYPEGLGSRSFQGLYGYQVFFAVAVYLADGLYNMIKIVYVSWKSYTEKVQAVKAGGSTIKDELEDDPLYPFRVHVFTTDTIPWWIGAVGYVLLAVAGVVVIPFLYPGLTWYMVLVAYCIVPLFAVPNVYGMGLTDWDMASTYGKVAIFIFAAWGGVIPGLASCGILLQGTSSAATLMQDFRTGFITLSSPRAMFWSQVCGAFVGCFIAPAVFLMFWTAYPIGEPGSDYPNPYADVYRAMAILATSGVSALPTYCMAICGGIFGFVIIFNLFKDFLCPAKYAKFLPIPMAMAIPFYLGAWVAVDMMWGTFVKGVWEWYNPASAALLVPAVASGLIAGDGIWAIPAAVLSMVHVKPPLCVNWCANDGTGSCFSYMNNTLY